MLLKDALKGKKLPCTLWTTDLWGDSEWNENAVEITEIIGNDAIGFIIDRHNKGKYAYKESLDTDGWYAKTDEIIALERFLETKKVELRELQKEFLGKRDLLLYPKLTNNC